MFTVPGKSKGANACPKASNRTLGYDPDVPLLSGFSSAYFTHVDTTEVEGTICPFTKVLQPGRVGQ
ncbi:hypothetical protein [Streptomyces diacarni]|nr:hypothetical protein [Streptomyces diacarni]